MKFPIYRHLLQGGDVFAAGKKSRVDPRRIMDFKGVTLIEGIDPLDEGDDHGFGGDVEKILASLGPQIPPFEHMWFEIEASTIKKNLIDEFGNHVPSVLSTAIAVSNRMSQDSLGPCITLTGFVLYEEGTVLMNMIDVLVEYDRATGIATELKMGIEDKNFMTQLDDEVIVAGTWHLCYPAMYCISLMNCKNVATTTATQVSRSSNKAVRKREPKITYHTIVLPQKVRGGGGHGGGTHATPALHKVRGHFKHYSADAPLFGKHVGTYWWPWQVRGSKDSGISVADYSLKEK